MVRARSAAGAQEQPPPSHIIKAVRILNWFLKKEYGETISLGRDQCEIEVTLAGSWVDDVGLKEAIRGKHPDIAEYLDGLCKEIYSEDQPDDPQEPEKQPQPPYVARRRERLDQRTTNPEPQGKENIPPEPSQKQTESKPRERQPDNDKPQAKKKAEPIPTLATCKNRLRGASGNDPKCEKCADWEACLYRTRDRLTGIMVDISRNLLENEADEENIWHDYGTGSDFDFDISRAFIRDVALDYIKDVGEGKPSDGAKRLNPWTVHHLNRMVPEWGERFKGFSLACAGPMEGSCKGCKWLDGCRTKWLNWAVRIPLFITRLAMRDISGNAFKVLTCITSHVNWVPDDPHFGMCWLKYDQITTETGIKQPQHPIKELREKGHIRLEQITRRREDGGEFSNTNCFMVGWFEKLRALGVDTYSKATGERKKGGV